MRKKYRFSFFSYTPMLPIKNRQLLNEKEKEAGGIKKIHHPLRMALPCRPPALLCLRDFKSGNPDLYTFGVRLNGTLQSCVRIQFRVFRRLIVLLLRQNKHMLIRFSVCIIHDL